MKKLAVVFGVAAVATLTGCRDQDYDAKHGKQVQDEPKSIVTTPAVPEKKGAEVVPEKTPAKEIAVVEEKTPAAPVVVPEVKPLPPAPPAEEYTVYIVQNGDFLSKISKKYNVTINSIKCLNNLKGDKIRVGQKLKLPGKIDIGAQTAPVATTTVKHGAIKRTSFTAYTGATREYVVKNGDTLGSVAYGNGCNIRQLKQLNNLTSDSLKIGQKLKVPADAKAAAVTAGKKDSATAVKPGDKAKKVGPVVTAPVAAEQTPVVSADEAKTEAKVSEAEAALKTTEVEDAKPVEASADAASATTAAPVEAKSAPATTTYVVQEGEDLTRIAVDFGVTTSVIRELNNLGESDTVKPGQVLKLPAESQQ